MTDTTIIVNTNPGIELIISANRMMRLSTHPPLYAAMVPKITPPVTLIAIEDKPIVIDARAPQTNLAHTSRPKAAVPRGCSNEGALILPSAVDIECSVSKCDK